jgi:hypothetical protein
VTERQISANIELATRQGRINPTERPVWRRLFEQRPGEAMEMLLARQPTRFAEAAPPDNEAYLEYARTCGLLAASAPRECLFSFAER